MISKFIFVWCLLHLEAHVGYSSQYSEKSPDNTRCILDVSQKIYNVTDLLRCMNQFAMNLSIQNNDRLLKQTSRSDSLAYRETPYKFPYGNIILNLLNNEVPSINQDFPLDPTTSNYQLNYPSVPNESFNQFGGLGINLFNALSSISRYDDLKCVSRILCEVASGKPPGRYKQASTGNDKHYLGEFGRNVFSHWLVGTEASPILSFARAAVLGYSSNGNPAMCYRAFPRCPRNPDKLVHYLNNHNGGFFRFFSRSEYGSLPQSSYVSRGKLDFLGEKRQKGLPPGIAGAEADRTGTGKLKFGSTVLTAHDYGKNFFSKDNTLESTGRVVFSKHEESFGDENDRLLENKFSEFLSHLQSSDANTFSQDPIPFFPQESEEQGVRVFRFTPEILVSKPRSAFRFPH
ncbi:uncharacterized protein LOC115234961 [Formica exsecta]|uniref:uncharacterized protein LOC115234961 n=1 Tax=Formica exsecta TaxID=72781 RepID=UPI0011426CF3|nr:uncharacterized protein LOC115234961 [Formica exsecta]